ncbi:DNA-directed RNA polymerase [Mycena sanguinolenta]|uniref:DNA-directed RNA polymerase, mitochondrial n=1 Tax=Mycena sanguinolenta TaxID=230812 RepID=A0A8H7CB47_9AGAR|nr:DNA-directed RNA polymerase [Mycena sanguinolenta]
MLISRACRKAISGRGGRPVAPPRALSRGHAAAAMAVRRDDLQNFLQRQPTYAIIPPPLPQEYTSEANDYWFSDSNTRELMAVMNTCLYNLYDVPRAKGIFDRLRSQSSAALDEQVVNAMFEAYLKMAAQSEPDYWIDACWELADATIEPTARCYALMFLTMHRFPEYTPKNRSFASVLSEAVRSDVSISTMVADRVFTDDDEAAEIITLLSKSAIDLNLPLVVAELGETQIMGVNYPDTQVPEANPVMKNGEVPFNLLTLRKHLSRVALARRVLPTDVNARQKLLEDSVYEAAKERLAKQHAVFHELGLDDNSLLRPDLQRWMWQWHQKLKDRLETEIKAIAANELHIPLLGNKKTPILSPYLMLIKAEKLSMLTIVELMRLQGTGGVTEGMKTARALISIGKAVETEYKAQMCKSNNIEIPNLPQPPRDYFSHMGYRSLQERRIAAARMMVDNEGWTAPWTQALRSQIGAVLVECLMDVAEVTRTAKDQLTGNLVSEDQPAFYQSYEYSRGQKLGVIRLNPLVSQRLSKDPVPIHPRHLPMLVKPKPWVNYNEGGYLYSKSNVMRFKDSIEQRTYLKYASEQGHVELVYAGLDVLGSTPWRINKRVFDVVLEVWNSGKRLGKMPPEVYEEPEPEVPPDHDTDLFARNVYLTRMRAYNQNKAANHSDRCSVNYKIEISRSFLSDVFYLPHNVDFRGRAYPLPPHLNHIGDDLSRGLLMFAEKKPLGARGFRWLKIHLSNLYGYDKANFDERAAFTESHMDDIYDSVLHPLDGRGWWQKADDPLAMSRDVYGGVLRDRERQPGNHYAALGGDHQGAAQVNLSAGERPSDVYSYVGGMVEKMLEADAEKGDKYAIMLKGKVTRKVVKQTVMTTVYGVTFVGARDQIEKQLKDRKDLPEEECWLAASYLAKKVLSAIGDLFTGATEIQTWLNLCARLIAKSIPQERIDEAQTEHKRKKTRASRKSKKAVLPDTHLKKEQMTSVVWTTPLGLPYLPAVSQDGAQADIHVDADGIHHRPWDARGRFNSMKQASAFPPNFIHSLDATHMMLTAIECRVQGLTFASVHDSYWTHACSIDHMSEIIRDTFIALHSSDVLQKLEAEFKKRYEGFKVPLLHLRGGRLTKKLAEAGSRIKVTPQQALELPGLKELIEVDTEASASAVVEVESMKTYDSLGGLLEQLDAAAEEDQSPKKAKRKTKKQKEMEAAQELEDELLDADEDAAVDMDADADDEEALAVADKEAAIRIKKEEERLLLHKFVDLTSLLPPLPKKGSFEVKSIKDSPYFFS